MTATHEDTPRTLGAGCVRVVGEVRRPRTFAMDDLLALPQREAEISFLCRKSGVRRHRFTGPLLLDVVAGAEPAFVPDERKDRLRFVISLRAADRHRVVLAWAEIDPEFGNGAVLLGVTRDGRALPSGPQLVVPGDMCGARNVSDVVEMRVYTDPAD
jgi:DMSO/TMAO reductase YedYZ molybdopterin-dependent catalytic subunit